MFLEIELWAKLLLALKSLAIGSPLLLKPCAKVAWMCRSTRRAASHSQDGRACDIS